MTKLPFISIVIPAFNEATLLPMCLQSLKEQNYLGKYEIIVVDNNSTDLTPQIAKLYGARVITENRPGVAPARQAGFMAAGGGIICSTDADTVVPPDWLARFAETFAQNPRLVAAGGWFNLVGLNNLLKIIIDFIAPLVFILDWLISRGGSLYGVNCAIRKSAFLQAGGFRTDLIVSEDIDLSQRLKKIGPVKVTGRNPVKTSSRRFDTGILNIIRYEIINYFASVFWNKSIVTFAEAIREHPFEVYGSRLKISRANTIIFSAIFSLFIIGAFPGVNISSISHLKTAEKIIALTFDDGPNDPNTSQILDILNEKGIKAAFFLIGRNVEREPEVVKEIHQFGHIIGNHSESHLRRYMAGPPQLIRNDVEKAGNDICRLIGKKPRLFRPPYGYRTVWGDWELKRKGYSIITWDDMTADYSRLSPDKIIRNIVKKAQPGGIIVLHDGSEKAGLVNRSNTVAALPEIIDKLQAAGYRFVTLDQLLGLPAYFDGCN